MTALTNTETFGSASLVSKYEYVLNEKAQRSERTQSGSQPLNSTDSFTYDDLGQVTAFNNSVNTTQTAWNPLYNFDDIGNRTNDIIDLNGTKTYTSNLLNQIDSLEAQALLYDLDGNLTNVDAWTYTWNAENRLIRATDGVTTLDFAYDYQGRLVQKTKAGVETIYVYDGWNRVAKLVNGSQSETYLWGLDLSGSMQGAGGVGGLLKEGTLYPLFDANGNILQKLSATSSVVMNVSYDPFGNIIDGTLSGEYGFSTKPMVEDLNWYYYGFRYYDPETGRWPNRDPIEEQGGLNLYAFVGNDGVNSWDYLGNESAKDLVDIKVGISYKPYKIFKSRRGGIIWLDDFPVDVPGQSDGFNAFAVRISVVPKKWEDVLLCGYTKEDLVDIGSATRHHRYKFVPIVDVKFKGKKLDIRHLWATTMHFSHSGVLTDSLYHFNLLGQTKPPPGKIDLKLTLKGTGSDKGGFDEDEVVINSSINIK